MAAVLIGYLGTAFLVLSFQCKKERTLFLCQTLSGLCFVIHYGLNGDLTGMAMDGICFVRALLMYSGKKVMTGKGMLIGLCTVIVLLCVLTWEGFFSVFPTVALLVSTVFLYTGNGSKIRKAQFFVTSPSWMVYNIHVLSVPGIICEALDMLSVVVYAVRSKANKSKVED